MFNHYQAEGKFIAVKIEIASNRTVSELQKDFNKVFPFLKIEFFKAPYKSGTLLPASKLVRHDMTLSQFRQVDKQGELELNPEWTVAKLEQELWESYELSVQVFRKSGSLWIETSLTDSWTLRQQNYEGEQMSHSANPPKNIDMYDRDQAE